MTPKPKPTKAVKRKPKKKIRIADPDKWFSLCVRERAGWKCQHCGKDYSPDYTSEGLPKAQGLHCSHFIGRANYAVRFDPLNAEAHCYGCHAKMEGNPYIFNQWVMARLGDLFEVLVEKSNSIELGRQARREKNEIAKHYKAEFEQMRLRRDNGETGTIDFQGYF